MARYNQKTAVYLAITAYLNEVGRPFDDGDKLVLTQEDRKTITTMVVAFIETGDMEFTAKAKYNTPEKIRNYATGLISNWLRKDVRLTGGTKHTTKNPGSRIGQSDSLVKKLKALRKVLTIQKEIDKVDKEIETRIIELQREKASIPAHLLHLIK